jgi:uncharacterized membrane protein
MAFCPQCGSAVEGKYCGKCGAPAGGTGQSAPAAGAQLASLDENIAAALAYLLGVLTGVLFLVLEPYSRNRLIRFHALQSIFAWIAFAACGVVLNMMTFVLARVPFVGWAIALLAWAAYWISALGLWLLLMYKAYNRERWVLPVIGPLAEKQA